MLEGDVRWCDIVDVSGSGDESEGVVLAVLCGPVRGRCWRTGV